MGQCFSKHDMHIPSQVLPNLPSSEERPLVDGTEGSLGAAAESLDLEETEFSLAALSTVNPSAASFSRGLAAVQAIVQGVNVRVTMAAQG